MLLSTLAPRGVDVIVVCPIGVASELAPVVLDELAAKLLPFLLLILLSTTTLFDDRAADDEELSTDERTELTASALATAETGPTMAPLIRKAAPKV